jgi:hypothetical protein
MEKMVYADAEQALADLAALTDRTRGLAAWRAKDDRSLGAEARAHLAALLGEVDLLLRLWRKAGSG